MSRFAKVFTGVLAFVIVAAGLVTVATGWKLNNAVRESLLAQAGEALGAPVSVASLRYNPLNGELRLTGLAVGNPEPFASAVAIRVDSLSAQLDTGGGADGALRVLRLDLNGTRLALLETAAGDSNLERLLQHARARRRDAQPGGARLVVEAYNTIDSRANLDSPNGTVIDLGLPDLRLTAMGAGQGGLSVPELALELLRPLVSATVEEGVALGMLERAPVTRGSLQQLRGLIDTIEQPPPGPRRAPQAGRATGSPGQAEQPGP